jgi:hypothetical protein
MSQFYKLLADNLVHNLFTYQEGLNVDTVPFDPSGECLPGGLYFTTLEHLPMWYRNWSLIADVTVPDDARVYEEPSGTSWKADRLVLNNIRQLSVFLATLDETTLGKMIATNWMMLEHVDCQTETLCQIAIQRNAWALEMVKTQTEAMCLAAVRQNAYALEHVDDQTDAICLAAVQQSGWALPYVRKQTDEICLAAVQRAGCAVQHVHNQTEAICRAAVAQNPWAYSYVRIELDL